MDIVLRNDDLMAGQLPHMIYKINAGLKKKELKKIYDSYCNDVNLEYKFVYVPLHYQPERTTCPEGGFYYDQILMVKQLSSSIPTNWFLYVKEHPSQFFSSMEGELGRDKSFYDVLKSISNVRFVSLDHSSFTLIDRCQAIATVTGTAGLEAILRGKPALIFGYAWYRGCEGIFYTPNRTSLIKAIDKIIEGYHPNTNRVTTFFKFIEQEFIKTQYEDPSNDTLQEDSEALVRLVENYMCGID